MRVHDAFHSFSRLAASMNGPGQQQEAETCRKVSTTEDSKKKKTRSAKAIICSAADKA